MVRPHCDDGVLQEDWDEDGSVDVCSSHMHANKYQYVYLSVIHNLHPAIVSFQKYIYI